jgi:hypothetical protein
VARAVAADAALDFDPALAHVGTSHEVGDGIMFFLAKPSQAKPNEARGLASSEDLLGDGPVEARAVNGPGVQHEKTPPTGVGRAFDLAGSWVVTA